MSLNTSIRFNDSELQVLEDLCKHLNTNRSDVIKLALLDYELSTGSIKAFLPSVDLETVNEDLFKLKSYMENCSSNYLYLTFSIISNLMKIDYAKTIIEENNLRGENNE